jgi:hypothetical protein
MNAPFVDPFAEELARLRSATRDHDQDEDDAPAPIAGRRSAKKADAADAVVPNLASAMTLLRHDSAVADLLAYDEMLDVTMLMGPVPARDSSHGAPNAFEPRPITDTDVSAIQEWLQLKGLKKIGRDTTHQAVDLRARERAFHPVRDFLGGLVRDGKPRLGTWLADYFGAERSAYTAEIGRMFLVSRRRGRSPSRSADA